MIGPRHMGSSPTVKRQLSRLSSSSSFQVRQSNSRIYTFLVAGGLLLLATVALLQFHLQGAPQSSKLSPRENGKPVEGIVPATATKDQANAKNKFGRRMGSVQAEVDGGDEEEESNDDDGMDVMEGDEDEDTDEDALLDIDVDDRISEDEDEDSSTKKVLDGLVNGHDSNRDDDHKTVPEWVLDGKVGSEQVVLNTQLERDLVKGLEEKTGSFYLDHALGLTKSRSLENVVDGEEEEEEPKDMVNSDGKHLKGFKDFVERWKERFNSDDELVDENVQQRLESVHEIEDALLLNGDHGRDKSSSSSSSKTKLGKKKGSMNPTSNPMLQDPDTPPGTWMTKTDKQMLRAFRGGQQPKASLLRGNHVLDSVLHRDSASTR